jgi:hypothetical protein
MTAYMDMYNSLRTIVDANKCFVQRDIIFSQLAPLISKYDTQFGVCLIHSHCSLEPGVLMIATGNVCEPQPADTPHYPERWLASSEPFEFTTDVTSTPPAELFAEFQRIVGNIGVLGLYFVGASAGTLKMEWTEGRKNMTKTVSEHGCRSVETAWLPGTKNPTQLACTVSCAHNSPKKPPKIIHIEPQGN